jgi:hypothetical protein
MSEICLKTVFDLRVDDNMEAFRYHIPSYQRGYRWSPTQVTQLLDDILEFTTRQNPQPKEFYCLQPLVLRVMDDGRYEVVDGQQRLTTLLLILRHFNARLAVEYQDQLFQLSYEIRNNLHNFLDIPRTQENADTIETMAASNIDFFHINQAIITISEWFRTRGILVEKIKDTLGNNAKVIWFQLSAGENAIAAFTRLNVGKIPLTNGELIRALFLKGGNVADERLQLQIAHEWDNQEKALQNQDFWCFLSNDMEKDSGRIGFIFDLLAQQAGVELGQDDYATFNHFAQQLDENNVQICDKWLEIKKTFMVLEEWFVDRRLYHLIGYLIWRGDKVNTLLELAEKVTKTEFKEKLRAKVLIDTFGVERELEKLTEEWIAEQLNELRYDSDKQKIRSILLLFNIATLLLSEESNMRFQFESFKTYEWDIEHVRSRAVDMPTAISKQKEWLEKCLAHLGSVKKAPELQANIQDFINRTNNVANDEFENLYNKILPYFHEHSNNENYDEHESNGLFNLVLLDKTTNRSYKNAVFAVKRDRVLDLDRHGVFVPLCTRNVFLKCYNRQDHNVMFWTEMDRKGYDVAMSNALYEFFTGAWING